MPPSPLSAMRAPIRRVQCARGSPSLWRARRSQVQKAGRLTRFFAMGTAPRPSVTQRMPPRHGAGGAAYGFPGPPDGSPAMVVGGGMKTEVRKTTFFMATTAFPSRDDFAALLNESLGGENETFEGKVVKGIVTGIENDLAVIDVGLKSEGRVAAARIRHAGPEGRAQGRRRSRSLCRPRRECAGRSDAQPRPRPPRSRLGQAREGIREGASASTA